MKSYRGSVWLNAPAQLTLPRPAKPRPTKRNGTKPKFVRILKGGER